MIKVHFQKRNERTYSSMVAAGYVVMLLPPIDLLYIIFILYYYLHLFVHCFLQDTSHVTLHPAFVNFV